MLTVKALLAESVPTCSRQWQRHAHTMRGVNEIVVPDNVLVSRLVAGDEHALRLLYDRYGSVVYGIAHQVTRDEQIARDITQDVFVYVWEHATRVDLGRGSIKSFLAMLSHRRSVDAIRASERRNAREQRVASEALRTDSCDHDLGSTVVHADAQRWQQRRIAQAMGDLSDDQRTALQLAYFDGLTYREVATKLNIPEGTAKSRLRLAIARLRESLAHEDHAAWTVP
jgi:RNA polymerase sigma-70 factor, ECF subfamily